MDPMNGTAVNGICASYFENHVSPVLKYIQQAQEQLNAQLRDLRSALEQKANKADVPTLEQLERTSTKGPTPVDTGPVTTQVRWKEISAAVQRKADVGNVASLAQFNKLVTAVEQKANSKDVITPQQLLEGLERKASVSQVQDLVGEVARKANLEQLRALRSELLAPLAAAAKAPAGSQLRGQAEVAQAQAQTQAQTQAAAPGSEMRELKRVQLVVAAAGAHFNRQLTDVRRQLRELRASGPQTHTPQEPQAGETGESADTGPPPDPRWPGRALPLSGATGKALEPDAASATGSEGAWSLGGTSLGGTSTASASAPELSRLRAVLGAAGATFSRELREVRGQLRGLQAELRELRDGSLRGQLHPPHSSA